jgi:3-oxoadipate enol-lactonase
MPAIEVNGTNLYYQVDGPADGPALMLSNSLQANLAMWDSQFPALINAGLRVIRYDSRGHGRSAAPPGPYSIELLANDALAIIDALGLETVHFCGLSMGGMVGQMLAVQQGTRLQSLTLCATAAHMPPRELWDQRIALAQKEGMAGVVDAAIDRWFTKAGQERLHAEVHSIRDAILATPVDGYCACCAAIRDMDQRESIRSISMPTLIMVGELDVGTPPQASRLLHERIACSTLVVFPDAKHFVNVEQAAAFNDTLLGFLKSQPPL